MIVVPGEVSKYTVKGAATPLCTIFKEKVSYRILTSTTINLTPDHRGEIYSFTYILFETS